MPTEKENVVAFVNDPLRTIVIKLGKNANDRPLPELDGGNFVECTFPGYAPVTIDPATWALTDDSEDDLAQVVSHAHFESTEVVTPERVTVIAMFQTFDTGGAKLLRYFWLDPTYMIDGPHELDFDVRLVSVDLT